MLQLTINLGKKNIENQPVELRLELADDDCIHVVKIGIPAQVNLIDGAHSGSMLDIETFIMASLDGWKAVRGQVDLLHSRSIAIFFEKLLTKEGIERLEPEY